MFRLILESHLKQIIAFLAWLVPVCILPLVAIANEVPDFIGVHETSSQPTNSTTDGLNFVAVLDDAPFSFVDKTSKLSGFTVFLARAICEELNVSNQCVISGQISASLSTPANIDRSSIYISNFASRTYSHNEYRFSRPFLRIPGRFVVRREATPTLDFDIGLPQAKIGTLANSAEEQLLRSYFPKASIIGFADETLLLSELTAGKIDLAFGNGLQSAKWLTLPEGRGCCVFAGKPYYSTRFLGEGVRFAVPSEIGFLVPQIDAALVSLQRKGKIEELYLQFFPVSFY